MWTDRHLNCCSLTRDRVRESTNSFTKALKKTWSYTKSSQLDEQRLQQQENSTLHIHWQYVCEVIFNIKYGFKDFTSHMGEWVSDS